MAIMVRAKQDGYYGTYRVEGAEFEIEDEKAFSKIWMERVSSASVKDDAKEKRKT